MSAVISGFLAWAANVLVLSSVLWVFFFALRMVESRGFALQARSRLLFLRISFFALPFLPAFWAQGAVWFHSWYQQANVPLFYYYYSRDLVLDLPLGASQLQGSSAAMTLWAWIALALFISYLCGLMWGLGRLGFSAWTIHKVRRASESFALSNGKTIYLHDHALPPSAAGFWRPVILIPRTLLQSVTDHELKMIVEHESIHLERFDPLWNLLRLVVKEFLFFSPFAHWLSRTLEEEMELAIDETILSRHQGETKSYGALLLRLCTQESMAATPLCNGLFKTGPFLRRRIENMKGVTTRRPHRIIVIAFGLGFVSCAGMMLPRLGLAEKSKVEINLGEGTGAQLETYCGKQACSEEFKKTFAKAQQGDREAQNALGEMFHFGRGVAKDYAEARAWYLRASEQGHGNAANHLGRLYLNGEGVSKNAIEACNWYIVAGERGEPWGMMNAASCFKYGHGGFGKDEAKSREWYARAEKAQPGIYQEYENIMKESKKESAK